MAFPRKLCLDWILIFLLSSGAAIGLGGCASITPTAAVPLEDSPQENDWVTQKEQASEVPLETALGSPEAVMTDELVLTWQTLATAYSVPLGFPILSVLRDKATAAYRDGDDQATHILLDQMFRLDSKRPDIMALKGWVYCRQAEYIEAQLWLQRARVSLDSGDPYDALLQKAAKDCQ